MDTIRMNMRGGRVMSTPEKKNIIQNKYFCYFDSRWKKCIFLFVVIIWVNLFLVALSLRKGNPISKKSPATVDFIKPYRREGRVAFSRSFVFQKKISTSPLLKGTVNIFVWPLCLGQQQIKENWRGFCFGKV